ncbi:DUF2568 domain-containing protein [Nocardia sp. NPDC088792]|uniref:DUF2568 domain-containing protein n=1 Tax=Nocardia sp. NPDC088792 TaxID=3364332 RepID=UPI003800F12C
MMISTIWHDANLTLAFLLELVAYGALAWWGMHSGRSRMGKVLRAVGAVAAAAVLWALFAAPAATFHMVALAVITEIAVYGAAATAFVRVGYPRVAVAFPVVVVVNMLLVHFT